jgi:UDP-N-acetylglucosamine--N-acetylmuramyl-(pentapeptide) pyrophosphoryl-undecaprenol N-acetylglucosamine transferase
LKVLFVVCGEGLGHGARCLQLAEYFESQGATTIMGSYGKTLRFMTDLGHHDVYPVTREVHLEGKDGIFSLHRTLWSSRRLPFNLLQLYRETRSLIRTFNPDCVVADTMYAALFAAVRARVPAVFMTNQNHFANATGDGKFVWRVLNALVRRFIAIADAIAIPDFAPPGTITGYNIQVPQRDSAKYHFVGPVINSLYREYLRTKETIFVNFGGEPYKAPLYGMFRQAADHHPELCFEVFSTAAGLPEPSSNFHVYGFVNDIYRHLARAKVAVLHGGLTTLQEALSFGKPVVVIIDPRHPEQWNNALKIEAMKTGIIVNGETATPEELCRAIRTATAIEPPDLSGQFARQDGKKNAWQLICRLVAEKKGKT